MTKSINLKMQQDNAVIWFTNANVPIDTVQIVVGSADTNTCDLAHVRKAFTIDLTVKEFEYFCMHACQQLEAVKEYIKKKEPKVEMFVGEEKKGKGKRK